MIRVHHLLQDCPAGEIQLSDEEAHYLTHVRRVRIGQTVQLFDGAGRVANAVVTNLAGERGAKDSRSGVTVAMELPQIVAPSTLQITAVIPLIKGDRFEICLEKLTEVGVDHIILWLADRAVVQVAPAKLSARLSRWHSTLTAAARQAHRTHTPTLTGPLTLEQLTKPGPAPATGRFVLDPHAYKSLLGAHAADQRTAGTAMGETTLHGDLMVVTGPEGGITAAELEALQNAGFQAAKLGANVLRAETAPVIATALLRLCGLTETL